MDRSIPTGLALKLERIAARVSQGELAARMGIARQTVWLVERAAQVQEDRAEAYRLALREIATERRGGDPDARDGIPAPAAGAGR